ncbi:MAG: DUF2357 domain-containing protein [Kiritimatiellae bacterium]|nr:DUF2357 domain-containing protein [Kiritimatiellia bacterium]
MAMSETVYTYEHGDIFTLKVLGRNDGRYEAYCKRIGVEEDSEGSLVEVSTPAGTEKVKPPFFETRYFVRCDFRDSSVCDAVFFHKMASVSEAFDFDGKTLVGVLDFVNAPGKFHFDIVWHKGDERKTASFDWMVVSEKLDVQSDYSEIVKTIEENAPGLVRAFLAKSKGAAGLIRRDDTNDAIWADIFNEIGDRYQRACEWIVSKPHLKYISEVEYRQAGRVKRWTPGLVNRYAAMDKGVRAASLFRTEQISPQVDTVENRFVKFTMRSIADRLEKFASVCEGHKTVSEVFVKDLRARAAKLAKTMRNPFFAGVGRFTGLRQESMVLQRRQGYADIYATWLMLKRTLDTTQTGLEVGHRPISALYEFWCFLRIADLLEKDFGFGRPEGRIEGARVYDDLFDEPDPDKIDTATLSALSYKFPEKDGTSVRLLYQQNYGKEAEEGDLAYYNPQRPDIVLAVERGKDVFTYLFDAKYRIGERDGLDASPAEPINDMHRYRDAILYRAQEGEKRLSRQVVGAYVLYPGRPAPMSYDYAGLIRAENIGAIPLLPGEAGGAALKAFLGEILAKRTSEEHLGADIPTRGTTVVVAENVGEFLARDVVYGTYHAGQLEWIKARQLYNMPVERAALIGIGDEEAAKEKKVLFLVSGKQGHRETPSVFRIKRGSARKMSRAELEAQHGYRKGKPEEEKQEYWVWELEGDGREKGAQ